MYYGISNELKERYVSTLKRGIKKLHFSNRRFAQEYLNYVTGNQPEDKGFFDNLNGILYVKKSTDIKDIFPPKIYPALDVIMGEQNRKSLITACKYMRNSPFTRSYYRKMFRSKLYGDYFESIQVLFENLVELYVMNLNIIQILKKEYDANKYYGELLHSKHLMAQINAENQEVISLVKEMIEGENNVAVLTYEVFRGIFASDNKELVELVGKLLLAGKLQEGLRQAICETMDSGTFENFKYMFNIVYENNLMRFSSVKRALNTWTGLGDEYAEERVTKKELELFKKLLDEPVYVDELLKSEDNVELTLALVIKGCEDVALLEKEIDTIIKHGKYHNKLLCSYVLTLLQADNYLSAFHITKNIIKEYKDDMKMMACYIKLFTYRNAIIKMYFKNENEIKEFFDIFETILVSMGEKQKVFSPCIFPWNSEVLERTHLTRILGSLAILLNDSAYTDRIAQNIHYFDGYDKGNFINMLFKRPSSKVQKDAVISILTDRNSATNEAYEIVVKNKFANEYIPELENSLRLKSGDVRKNVINLLYSQDDSSLKRTIENLLKNKNENYRLGGLDLLLRARKDEKISLDDAHVVIDNIKAPTSAETVLINEILKKEVKEELFYDATYEPNFELEFTTDKTSKNKNAIQIIDVKTIFDTPFEKLIDILEKLDKLVTQYENYEYKNVYGQDLLLGDNLSTIVKKAYYDRDNIKNYPLSEVWTEFYEKETNDFKILYQFNIFLAEYLKRSWEHEWDKNCVEYINKMLGIKFGDFAKLLDKKKLKYLERENYRNQQVSKIINVLYETYELENKSNIFEYKMAMLAYVYDNFDMKNLINKGGYYHNKDTYKFSLFNVSLFSGEGIFCYDGDEDFEKSFKLRYALYKKKLNFGKENSKKVSINSYVNLIEYVNAIKLGIIKEDEFYIEFLDRDITANCVSSLYTYFGTNEYRRNDLMKNKYYKNNKEVLNLLKQYSDKVVEYIVSLELKRGDTPTKYSNAIHKIEKIEGIDNLVAILQALDKEKLERSTWSFGDAKKSTLSHLLRVCEPAKDDTSSKLQDKLANRKITTQRLAEVAMYAPQWIPILEEYLGWSGLASGCYYFQAHMSDVDRKKEGLFAKYTPISIEDLAIGAFDIDWFKSAYKELGEERFDMLYESAKYISDGAKHSRARKFADAVNGKFTVEEVEKEITNKRNKDLVASYSLIPLAKEKTKDMLRRYKFLQKFLKDSKQFGAQRRASEAKAVEIALENLSRNAGFTDVTRLTWAMETELMNEMKEYFAPKQVDDITAYIQVDEEGTASIIYEKNGKILKSLPAKLKKDTYIVELKEVHKNLKDQYSRSKKMLEESMEDATVFYVYEIENLTKNPIVYPLIKNLVMESNGTFGYYKDKKLVSFDNKEVALKDDDEIKIAHALDLYNNKIWATYQKDLFDRQIKQAFKQVFRELYVKTADEKGKDTSLRYAGHQIQPQKTIALLKTRRWVVDSEEGLQKVYYKQNIIAKIYALADWFSPADIEAPTLEYVDFYDRKTFKQMKIDDVPDLIFTEVMRDVDLAVSVAHVGGVDVETSHSTIEMRKAIVKFNLELFKITNVEFTDNFALIKGSLAKYSVHLGSGVVHQKAGATINVLPVHSQHRGRLFLPFIDEDPKTAEIMSKIILFAEDKKIKDPFILEQIR